jgi:NHS family xanthosine MFS transporter
MNIKLRLTALSFFQFFVWGAWLITIANYWFGTKHWDGTKFGAVFSTMGIACFYAYFTGIIADRWINAEKFMVFSYFVCWSSILFTTVTPENFLW